MMFSRVTARFISVIVVFGLACVSLMYFSDKLAKFIGYFGAMFILPVVMAILITFTISLINKTRAKESTWMYILNSVVSILPSIYLFFVLTFVDGL